MSVGWKANYWAKRVCAMMVGLIAVSLVDRRIGWTAVCWSDRKVAIWIGSVALGRWMQG